MKLTKIAAVLITTISLSNTAFSADKPNLGDITWGGGMEVQPGDTGWPSDLPMWGGGEPLKPNDPGYQSTIDIINSVSDVANKAYDDAQINKKDIKDTNERLDTAISKGQTALEETNKNVAANTGAIEDINGRLDGTSQKLDDAISKGQTALDSTNEKLDTAISKGQTALEETNKNVAANTGAIEDINGRLDGTSQKLDDAISKGQTALDSTNEKLDTAISKGQTALEETNGAIKDTNSKLDSSLEEQKKVNYLVGNALASNESYWQQQWATNDNYAASINQNKSDIAKNRQDINKLNSRVDRLDQKVDDLNDTMKRGFASQAALNGLFQPYGVGKLNATMALGGYESKTAIAAGTGYRFDENTAVKAGIATNTDDFKGVTYNVGVNVEW
ncbi:YadA C-terminal domain-containing protein [Providencia stuartii]|uniref:YadA C-terminal domain-containing protein n=1 Tax=Providencia stuartii TaxID=588 RepID=UPI001873BE5F|nr:YadA C-terminal domain-containing protein [Providencia thailandensis]GHC07112.1 hypothetical protein GCM10007290_39910 [Providencia thailandensis]